KKVVIDCNHQGLLFYSLQNFRDLRSPTARNIMTVHGPCELPVTVGIESFYQFVSLVINVSACFKMIELVLVRIGLCELIVLIIPIGEHGNGPGCLQSFLSCVC